MPAFTGLGTDPCSILNVQSLSSTSTTPLWISGPEPSTSAYVDSTDGLVFSEIATNGRTRTFLGYYTSPNDGSRIYTSLRTLNVLNSSANLDSNTNYPVKKFMISKQVKDILLDSGTANVPFTILDVARQTGTDLPLVTEYKDTFSASSAFSRLTTGSYIIKDTDIYNPDDINDNTKLLGLYLLEQEGSLTNDQRDAKIRLEDRNKKFFAAFLAEYCFYRTRYQWLLQKYFNVFKISPYTNISITGGLINLFAGQGTADNQYSSSSTQSSLTQSDYLKGIAYHLATLSKRMANMRAILDQVNNYYDNILQEIQRRINAVSGSGSNAQLQQTLQALRNSASESKKAMDQTQFMESAMKYTQEKNRYANVLLGLYAFLNIAALAMIFKLRN